MSNMAFVWFGAALLAGILFLTAGDSPAEPPSPPAAKPAYPSAPVTGKAHNGGQLFFDGVYYDYRAPDGVQGIKLWTPPAGPIRGVILYGNPGGGTGGDTRGMARDERLQVFAARHRLAIAGVTAFPGRDIYSRTGRIILDVLEDWGEMGFHPELATLPLIPTGSSNAGITAYGLTCLAPERTICMAPNVGPIYNPATPPEAALQVPAILHIGPEDPLLRGGVEKTTELFARLAGKNARWCWDAEEGKGHAIGHINDVDFAFFEACVKLRVPAEGAPDAAKGLRTLAPESGWLIDLDSWKSGLATIAPYAEYKGDKTKAGWLPNADIAFLERGLATYGNPIQLSARDIGPADNPNESGTLLQSVGGPVVMAGSRIALTADAAKMSDWETLEFYRGATRLKTIRKGEAPECEWPVDGQVGVAAFVVLAHGPEGKVRTSYPMHFLVNTPQIEAALREHNRHALDLPPAGERTFAGADPKGEPPASAKADPRDAVLVAYALSAEQEKTFAKAEGLSAFWKTFTDAQDSAAVTASADPSAPAKGPRMTVRAAYSRDGLYLLLLAEDTWQDKAPPDSADFHISRFDPAVLWTRPAAEQFSKTSDHSLTLTTIQYQLDFDDPKDVKGALAMNIPSPWDLRRVVLPAAEAQKRYGIVLRQVALPDGGRAQEWFLPWSAVGSGGPFAQPAQGTRLAVEFGYNDVSPDPKKPGAVTRASFRWPYGMDVWKRPANLPLGEGNAINPYGALLLGPALERAGAK